MPEFEPKIFKIFQDADRDKDNLLTAEDLMNTFPQGHKYSKETAGTIFRDLTGRDPMDSGARMDWSTFYQHLQSCSCSGLKPTDSLPKTQWGIFSGVVDVISEAANSYFQPAQRQSMEEMLKALHDMGFTTLRR